MNNYEVATAVFSSASMAKQAIVMINTVNLEAPQRYALIKATPN